MLGLSGARHCYIRVTCPDRYDVTLELYGPGPGWPNGRPMMSTVPNPARNANADVSPIVPVNPSDADCCKFEDKLIDQFNLNLIPPHYDALGPNSNTFAANIINPAGGIALFPQSAIGANYHGR